MVPNLEIIPKNASSSCNILVIFIDSRSAHALKVKIVKVLLLLMHIKARIHIFRDDEQDHKLSLKSENESFRLHRAEKLTFEYLSCPPGDDIFLEFV